LKVTITPLMERLILDRSHRGFCPICGKILNGNKKYCKDKVCLKTVERYQNTILSREKSLMIQNAVWTTNCYWHVLVSIEEGMSFHDLAVEMKRTVKDVIWGYDRARRIGKNAIWRMILKAHEPKGGYCEQSRGDRKTW